MSNTRKLTSDGRNPEAEAKPEFALALIFRLEGIVADVNVDYTLAMQLLQRHGAPARPGMSSVKPDEVISSLKDKMTRKEYADLEADLARRVETAEANAIRAAKFFLGAKDAIEKVRSPLVAVAAITDLQRASAERLLRQQGWEGAFDALSPAPAALAERKPLGQRLKELAESMGVPADACVYFCNSSAEVKEAHKVGMRVVAFPSRSESTMNLLLAKPEGLLVSLGELETMLAVDEWKPKPKAADSAVSP